MQKTLACILSGLCLSVGAAAAQEPVVVDESLVDALTAEPAIPAAAPAAQSIDPDTARLQALLKTIDRTTAEKELLQLQSEVIELQKTTRGGAIGTAELPVLVGLSGRQGAYKAEFLMGDALMHAGAGDWVSAEWRVVEVAANSVTLRNARGNQTHTMRLGSGGGATRAPAR
jgi:hypothetical protein